MAAVSKTKVLFSNLVRSTNKNIIYKRCFSGENYNLIDLVNAFCFNMYIIKMRS